MRFWSFLKHSPKQQYVQDEIENYLSLIEQCADHFVNCIEDYLKEMTITDEFMGWAKPGLNKFSVSKSFLSWWFKPNKRYRLDTNKHGGERAYVMSGEYDKVIPMDILPVQLVKSIIIEDIDLMENLGIYEVDEEDFALCEFVCTSKTPVQSVVRQGLNMMIEEMS